MSENGVNWGGGILNVEFVFEGSLRGSNKGFFATSGVIIFEAGIVEFPRTKMGGGEDGGVDGFEGAGGGMKGNASAYKSDLAAGKFMTLQRKIVFSLVVIWFDLRIFFGFVQVAPATGVGGVDEGSEVILLNQRSLYLRDRSV